MERGEPTTYQKAIVDPNSMKWVEAMKAEMQSMFDNKVWTLVAPPEGVKPVGCKWVFQKKTDMDGNVSIFKARLVAKGFMLGIVGAKGSGSKNKINKNA